MPEAQFLDEVEITVRSGKGGDGMVHFLHERHMPRGGPDGGGGAAVILQVDPSMRTLHTFRFKKQFVAEDGQAGGVNKRSGRGAEDLVLRVPPGTLVYDASGVTVGDLTEPDQPLVVAKGGRGGRGNQHFAHSRNQTPRIAEKGEPGQEKQLRLGLKLIADIGIVGVPTAGKSTLLAALT